MKQLFLASFRFFLLHLIVSCLSTLTYNSSKNYLIEDSFKPGLHIGRKNHKHRPEKMHFIWLGLYMVVMIVSIELSRKIFAIDMLSALKSSLKHRRKHVLRSLSLVSIRS